MAIPNPRGEGKPWFKMMEIEVTREYGFNTSRNLGSVADSARSSALVDGLLRGDDMSEMAFDLGAPLQLQDLPMFQGNGGGGALALTNGGPAVAAEQEEKANMDAGIVKMQSALANLHKVRVKILQALSGMFTTIDHKKFVETKVSGKKQIVDQLIADYEHIVQHRTIQGQLGPTTSQDLKAKIARDSKEVSNIAALLQVSASFHAV